MLTALTSRIAILPFKHVTSLARIRLGAPALNSANSIRQLASPINKKEVTEDNSRENDLVKVDDELEVQIDEPTFIEPVQQKLISRIPVEYHGIRPTNFNDDTTWLPIYRVPYIHLLRNVIRAKVYLTATSVFGSLYYIAQLVAGNLHGGVWQACSLSIISLLGMGYIGDYFRRLVVQVYASEDLQYVRLCRFTFFGNRRDMVLPKDCIIRLPETNRSLRQPMFDLKFQLPEGNRIEPDYDNYEFYELGFKLPIGLGGVLDRDRFQSALGYMLSYRVGA